MTSSEVFSNTPDKTGLIEKASDAAIAVNGVVAVCDAAVVVGGHGPLGERRIRFRLSLVVEYGARLPDVAAEVRLRVASAVEDGVDCRVTDVDVTVADLYVHGEPNVAAGLGINPATGARIDF